MTGTTLRRPAVAGPPRSARRSRRLRARAAPADAAPVRPRSPRRPAWPFPGSPACVPGVGPVRPVRLGTRVRAPRRQDAALDGPGNSPATFGHFGGAGTFLWVDPVARPRARGADRPRVRALGARGLAGTERRRVGGARPRLVSIDRRRGIHDQRQARLAPRRTDRQRAHRPPDLHGHLDPLRAPQPQALGRALPRAGDRGGRPRREDHGLPARQRGLLRPPGAARRDDPLHGRGRGARGRPRQRDPGQRASSTRWPPRRAKRAITGRSSSSSGSSTSR